MCVCVESLYIVSKFKTNVSLVLYSRDSCSLSEGSCLKDTFNLCTMCFWFLSKFSFMWGIVSFWIYILSNIEWALEGIMFSPTWDRIPNFFKFYNETYASLEIKFEVVYARSATHPKGTRARAGNALSGCVCTWNARAGCVNHGFGASQVCPYWPRFCHSSISHLKRAPLEKCYFYSNKQNLHNIKTDIPVTVSLR